MVSSGWIRNSAKSSEIEKARLPLTSDSLTVFAEIVPIVYWNEVLFWLVL